MTALGSVLTVVGVCLVSVAAGVIVAGLMIVGVGLFTVEVEDKT